MQQPTPTASPVIPRYLRTALVGESVHFLNNSRSKYVCIGLSPGLNFAPAIVIGGCRTADVLLDRVDWSAIQEEQGVLFNYLQGDKRDNTSITIGNINIYFGVCGKQKVIKIEDRSEQFVSLGLESINGLFSKSALLSQKLCELEQNKFVEFYTSIIKCVKTLKGDPKDNIVDVLRQLRNDTNVCVMYDLVDKLYPKVITDIQECTV